jgi:hypothetical protein
MAGFEPGSSALRADAITTTPRRQGHLPVVFRSRYFERIHTYIPNGQWFIWETRVQVSPHRFWFNQTKLAGFGSVETNTQLH